MKKYLPWLLTAGTIVAGYLVLGFVRIILSVNEPDPASVSVERVADILKKSGFDTVPSEILYVNLDFDAYIFVGTPPSLGQGPDWIGQIDGAPFETMTGTHGLIRWRQILKGRDYVGVIVSSERSELRQGLPRFEAKWTELTGSKW